VGRPIILLAIGASLLLSGCARTSQSDIEKAKAQGASEEAAKQKQASVDADIQKLKDDLAKAQASASSAATQKAAPQTAAPPAPAAKTTSCGGNLSVGPNTSCSFAANVEAEFYAAGGGTSTIEVYSPVTARYYTMKCVAGIPSVCRGGNNAVVYIR